MREVLHVNKAGIHIKVDDEFVAEMKEGQDMDAVFEETSSQHHFKQEGAPADAKTAYLLKLEY